MIHNQLFTESYRFSNNPIERDERGGAVRLNSQQSELLTDQSNR